MALRRGFQLEAHCFASQAKPCNSKMEQTAGPFCGSTTMARPSRTSLVVFVVMGLFVVADRVVMGDARGAGAGASLTGRAMGLGFGLDGAGACATLFFGLVGAGAGAGLAIFLKPGGFATGAFRAAGALAARLAYTPSVYWPLGAAFSLSLPRRTRALGAGLLAACGLAAAACLAPPPLGFTLAAVVGILILEGCLAADL